MANRFFFLFLEEQNEDILNFSHCKNSDGRCKFCSKNKWNSNCDPNNWCRDNCKKRNEKKCMLICECQCEGKIT